MAENKNNSLSILLDADALVALAKFDDNNHKQAVTLQKKLDNRAAVSYISPFTIPEVVTVLSYKVSQAAAQKFLKAARAASFLELEYSSKLRDRADKWFFQLTNKGTAYFDCVNMALLEHYKLDAIFSFDRVFPKNGFKIAGDLV